MATTATYCWTAAQECGRPGSGESAWAVLCICMYVCMCVHMCTCMYICKYVCVCMCVYCTYNNVCMYVHMYNYTFSIPMCAIYMCDWNGGGAVHYSLCTVYCSLASVLLAGAFCCCVAHSTQSSMLHVAPTLLSVGCFRPSCSTEAALCGSAQPCIPRWRD